MAKQRKIPMFNDTFDMSKLVHILRKNFIFYIIFGLIAVISAFTYLRYTPPIYEAYTILQINEEQENDLLKLDNVYGKTSINNLIELIRSREFLKRTLHKLNLYTTYYLEGKFLTSELYNKTPFFVEYQDVQSAIYNKNIYMEYNKKDDNITIEYSIDGKNYISHTIKRNEWTQLQGLKLYVNITNLNQVIENKGNKYYFRILDDKGAFAEHISGLNVSILNFDAQTIQIYYTSNNAQKTSDLVNTISEDFLSYNIEKKQERAQKVLAFIEDQMNIVYSKLDESEKQLDQFKKTNNITGSIFDDKAAIQNALMDNSQQIDQYKNQLQSLQKVNSQIKSGQDFNTVELISILSGSSSESMILNFLNGIQQLQKQKEQLLITVTPDNHKVKIIDQQINEQKKLLLDFIKITNDRIKTELDAAKAKTKVEKAVEIDEIELAKLKRIHSINQNYYDQLVSKRAEFMISKAGHVTNNLILQKSDIPQFPISPIPSFIIFVAAALAIMAMFILTLVRYMLYNDITSLNDISRFTDVPVAGLIPVSKQTNKINRFVVENKANSVITEAFRTLRSNLEFMHQVSNEKKIIVITSTISGEGKTFIAINLGGVLSMSGKRVILIDLDLRKPKVHLTFKSNNEHGLSTILIGKDNYKDCIIETEFENFNIITSGPPPPNPAELANSESFDNLLE
ncbi:MAG TPA: Wzz/FepE/Etk N-terminal domain-containing protein, partial [Bacteroidales bacterium]|nr:Wzz/FepE/Etk N-terminal domain-containing protein [Bacteroidales bacterium]